MGRAAALVAIPALALLSGCGSSSSEPAGDRIPGGTLTIYSSMPLNGDSGADAQAVVNGERMALEDIHGRIGRYRVVLESLDDATPQRGRWDPGQTTTNARLALADRTAVGYLGEFNSGASAISIPLLNGGDIPQISPASGAVGLTSGGSGASPGEPAKYYPTGVRTFARVVPSDAVQAEAQVHLQQSLGCKATLVLDDGEVDAQDIADSFQLAAQPAGLQVVGIQAFDPGASDYTSLVQGVSSTGADCVLISAINESSAALLTTQLGSTYPGLRIFASAGDGDAAYIDPSQGGIPPQLDFHVLISLPTFDASAYPPLGQEVLRQYGRLFGAPAPYAIYGYEAMSLMLSAIDRASRQGTRPVLRSSVRSAIFATHDRHSVLGTYSIDRDGDTTLNRYGIWRLERGHLEYYETLPG